MSDLWPYTARPSLYQLPGERIPPWRCACVGRQSYQRHTQPFECIPDEDVTAWRAEHPDSTALAITVRCLIWLRREFGG